MKTLKTAYECIPSTEHAKKILAERARQLSLIASNPIEETEQQLYVRFRLSTNEYYGIPFRYTKEIMRNQSITPVPATPSYIKGMINYRGKLLSIIQLENLFKLNVEETGHHHHIIIIDDPSIFIGIYTTSIEGMYAYDPKKIHHALPIKSAIHSDFVLGLDNHSTTLLNIENLSIHLHSLLKERTSK
jgi:purine-binding chemotaxis protein CheW